jgi:hypothetical protein
MGHELSVRSGPTVRFNEYSSRVNGNFMFWDKPRGKAARLSEFGTGARTGHDR